MPRIVVELRLPVSLGMEAIRERAMALGEAGFSWDASRPPLIQAGGRDEIARDNPTDRTIRLWGTGDPKRLRELEDEPDVVAVYVES